MDPHAEAPFWARLRKREGQECRKTVCKVGSACRQAPHSIGSRRYEAIEGHEHVAHDAPEEGSTRKAPPVHVLACEGKDEGRDKAYERNGKEDRESDIAASRDGFVIRREGCVLCCEMSGHSVLRFCCDDEVVSTI